MFHMCSTPGAQHHVCCATHFACGVRWGCERSGRRGTGVWGWAGLVYRGGGAGGPQRPHDRTPLPQKGGSIDGPPQTPTGSDPPGPESHPDPDT